MLVDDADASEGSEGIDHDDLDEMAALGVAMVKKALAKAKAKAKAKAIVPAPSDMPACLHDLPPPPIAVLGGYIKGDNGTLLGRVAPQYFNPTNPSAHIACRAKGHVKCSVWVMLKNVPDIARARVWIAIGSRFKTADDHKSQFNKLVYGSNVGPTGTLKPGG